MKARCPATSFPARLRAARRHATRPSGEGHRRRPWSDGGCACLSRADRRDATTQRKAPAGRPTSSLLPHVLLSTRLSCAVGPTPLTRPSVIVNGRCVRGAPADAEAADSRRVLRGGTGLSAATAVTARPAFADATISRMAWTPRTTPQSLCTTRSRPAADALKWRG